MPFARPTPVVQATRRDEPADLLASLTDADRRDLLAMGSTRRLARDDIVFLEGDAGGRVSVILAGKVSIERSSRSGKRVILGIREEGEIIGELAALDGTARIATGRAIGDVELLEITADHFLEFLAGHPDAHRAVWRLVTRRLREASDRQVEFASQDAIGRVCARLTALAENEPASEVVALPGGQVDLASWCGLTREATTRALGSLRTVGWIATRGKRIELVDPAGIRARGTI